MLFTLKTAIAIAKAHVILLRKKISFCEFCFILSSTLHRIRYIDFIVCSARSSLQPASMRSNTIISVTGKGEFCRTGVIRQTCITICGTQSCNRIVPCICDFVIRHCHIKICYHSQQIHSDFCKETILCGFISCEDLPPRNTPDHFAVCFTRQNPSPVLRGRYFLFGEAVP